jgi:hypothetical protein
MKSRILCAAITLTALWLPTATAKPIILGQVAPPGWGACSTPCEHFQRKVAPGNTSYRVPVGTWTITSWSALGSSGGQARLRVYRPTSTAGQYEVVQQSRFESFQGKNVVSSFATSLDAQGGDLLGLDVVIGVLGIVPTLGNANKARGIDCHPKKGERVGEATSCPTRWVHGLVNVSAKLVRR